MNLEFEELYPGHGSKLFVKWRHNYCPKIEELAKKLGILSTEDEDGGDATSKYIFEFKSA